MGKGQGKAQENWGKQGRAKAARMPAGDIGKVKCD